MEDVQGLFEDNLDENENSQSEINNNGEKISPSTSDSSVDSRVEVSQVFTPNRGNLRKRLSNPNTPNGNNNNNSSVINTPNAPNISTPTNASNYLQPQSFRRKHNSLSDSQKPV